MHSKGKGKLLARENYASEGKSAQFSVGGKNFAPEDVQVAFLVQKGSLGTL